MSRVLVFGSTSRVGSAFVARTGHRIHAAGRRDPRPRGLPVESFDPVELTDLAAVGRAVERSPAEAVVNFAAWTSVDAAEKERRPPAEAAQSPVFVVNALAPEAMARAAAASGKRFITLSTDFVFDGSAGPYPETAEPSAFSPAVGWYGWTKGEGERRVRAADPAAAVVRIAYPFRTDYLEGPDLARWICEGHRTGRLPPLFDDQQMTPTWVPDVGRAVEHLLESSGRGTFHAASPEATTPFEFGRELLSLWSGAPVEPAHGSLRDALTRPGATPRPVRGGLASARLPAEGVPLTSWREAIRLWVASERGR